MLAAGLRALFKTPRGVDDEFMAGAAGGSVTERTLGSRGLVGFCGTASAFSEWSLTESKLFSDNGEEPSLL